jgi:hypothetical protein
VLSNLLSSSGSPFVAAFRIKEQIVILKVFAHKECEPAHVSHTTDMKVCW